MMMEELRGHREMPLAKRPGWGPQTEQRQFGKGAERQYVKYNSEPEK